VLPDVVRHTFMALVAGGIVALGLLSLVQASLVAGLGVAAGGIAVAGSAFLLGGLVGFLFAIPRSSNSEDEQITTASGEGFSTRANTNLEQISDWLTKILVGVGLTQIGNVPEAASELGSVLAPLFGRGASAPVFAIAFFVYFSLSGFLLGYFWTRVFLPRALRLGELAAVIEQASRAEAVSNEVRVELRDLQLRARQSLEELAHEYERIRAEREPSRERMLELTNVFLEMRQVAREARLSEPQVRQLADSERSGERMAAIAAIQTHMDTRYADLLPTFIGDSKSAFEQYHAIRAALSMAHDLDDASARNLQQTLSVQRSDGWLRSGQNENAVPFALELMQILDGRSLRA
jgi:hypothetical protein